MAMLLVDSNRLVISRITTKFSKVSGLGILIDNPQKSRTHFLAACVYHPFYVVGFWLLATYCWFLLATLGCYSLRSQWYQSGSITCRKAGFSICVHCLLPAITWFWQGRRARQALTRNAVTVHRPALNWLRPDLGRSEVGGEGSMRFPMSVFKALM